jgi:hypothetical protein
MTLSACQSEYLVTKAKIGGILSSRDFSGPERSDKLQRATQTGEKACERLARLFDASTDENEQVFLAFEIKQTQKAIACIRDDDGLAEAGAMLVIGTWQALQVYETMRMGAVAR